jgi:hypothetical protein
LIQNQLLPVTTFVPTQSENQISTLNLNLLPMFNKSNTSSLFKIPIATIINQSFNNRRPGIPSHPINNVKNQTARKIPDKKNAAELILIIIRRIRLRRCPSYIDIRATPSTGNFTKNEGTIISLTPP